ncbi:TPA: hypothetical protein ACTUQ7_001181 [Klebsiella pneumoniae]|uniref:hypothetical protein n=1 Tax=Klebsiella TaxID=570 RepID=UPI000E3C7028|nr:MULTISPECIES: hypothetical protein [Klebsiella]MCI8217274.1 hypothetical protein [Klebsiella pneumoniae]MDO7165036.1 hypothetical protein [Klebsiella pneumoniae]HBX3306811.1 hypothetical protein [Klebsiella pneumoniae]HDV0215081.1 hypothetical protein [Klebsiella pneumoniae]
MNQFASVERSYPMSSGVYASKKEPSISKQQRGFKPTYYDEKGVLVPGDPVEVAELNFIFSDLYSKAALVDQILTARGK